MQIYALMMQKGRYLFMLANFEHREHKGRDSVWAGRYENLHNLPHWHMECELLYIEEGQVTVSLNNGVHSLEKGEAFFIDSREIHYIKGSSSSITEIIMFDARLLDEIAPGHRPRSPRLSPCPFIPDYYREIKKELHTQNPYFDLKVRSLLILLMLDIFRKEPLTDREKSRDNTSIENYKNLLGEIEEKCSYITFEDAAAFMGLSKPYFSRFFKTVSGMTFSQYLNIIRLEKAIDLLNHNTRRLSITDIASCCGFDTIRHFNRVFREFTGFSPRNLPENYVLTSHSVKSMGKNFNPTLPNSRLLEN